MIPEAGSAVSTLVAATSLPPVLKQRRCFLPSAGLGLSAAHVLKRLTGKAGLFPGVLLFLLAGAMALSYVGLDFKAQLYPCSRFPLHRDLNWSPASRLLFLALNLDSLVL